MYSIYVYIYICIYKLYIYIYIYTKVGNFDILDLPKTV